MAYKNYYKRNITQDGKASPGAETKYVICTMRYGPHTPIKNRHTRTGYADKKNAVYGALE